AQASGQPTGSIGLGFSIPSNQVRRTAEEIIETGRATYPVIGVALDTRYQGEGVQVLETDSDDTPAVTPGGPGEEAGIEPGDVITHIDGQPVTTPSELIVAVRARAPGDTGVPTVRSDDGEREGEVVLDEAVRDGRPAARPRGRADQRVRAGGHRAVGDHPRRPRATTAVRTAAGAPGAQPAPTLPGRLRPRARGAGAGARRPRPQVARPAAVRPPAHRARRAAGGARAPGAPTARPGGRGPLRRRGDLRPGATRRPETGCGLAPAGVRPG